MMFRALFAAAALTCGLAVFNDASATTYTSVFSQGGGTASFSITTDGTLGVLTQANITGFNIDITDQFGSGELTPANAAFEFFEDEGNIVGTDNGDMTANASNLFFNFRPDGSGVLFQSGAIGVGNVAFCFQSGGCATDTGPAVTFSTNGLTNTDIAESGLTVVGTAVPVSAAPEPATWLLMFTAIGGVGLVLRRAKMSLRFRATAAVGA